MCVTLYCFLFGNNVRILTELGKSRVSRGGQLVARQSSASPSLAEHWLARLNVEARARAATETHTQRSIFDYPDEIRRRRPCLIDGLTDVWPSHV